MHSDPPANLQILRATSALQYILHSQLFQRIEHEITRRRHLMNRSRTWQILDIGKDTTTAQFHARLNSGKKHYHSAQNVVFLAATYKNNPTHTGAPGSCAAGPIFRTARPPKVQRLKYSVVTPPLAMCGCETWFFVLRKKKPGRVFENRRPKKIPGDKREGMAGYPKWLHDSYSLSTIIRAISSNM